MNKEIRTKIDMTSQIVSLRKANYTKATHQYRCGNCRYGLPCIKLKQIEGEIKRVLTSVEFCRKVS